MKTYSYSTAQLKKFLEFKAYQLRLKSILMTSKAGSGHPTSCLSAADLVAAIFFYAMEFDPADRNNPDNDRFVLSKGHAAPLLYAVWHELGCLQESELYTYRQFNSVLEGHPTRRFAFSEAATGSLGIGLSVGAGIALSAHMDRRNFKTYVLLGDSELAEGSVWEAAEVASYYKLNNLIALVDCNRLGQTGETIHGYHLERYAAKFEAFGWAALCIDGHNINQIVGAIDKALQSSMPSVLLAKTIKGYGIEKVENKNGFHGKAFAQTDVDMLKRELAERFPNASRYDNTGYNWQPHLPSATRVVQEFCKDISTLVPKYSVGQMVATRRAYGDALEALGRVCSYIVSLDAEVKNSTYAQIFEQAYPERFVQCFIAEQNMVGMGVGLQLRGKIAYISTFAAFFSRAYDQLRMAAIGASPLRCCGSHAGVSIGEDGPSQMGLEDIACMSALPNSVVLYPCDAVSTYKLVGCMLKYNDGISYLRTTRPETPVIYAHDDDFTIGGCKILRSTGQDMVCIAAAGITLFEALKAYEALADEGIFISVVDVYSIKPLDKDTILRVARKSGNKIITVEDHYVQGGLGYQVCYAMRNENIQITCLAVTELPRSGKPQDLMAWACIDKNAIIKAVKRALRASE
jgi:transketolase